MTQYVDVLKKAIASLPESTPEGRAQLYAAARSALNRQLATNEAVPQEEKARQLAAFENAIATVEKSYAPQPVAPQVAEADQEPEPEDTGEPHEAEPAAGESFAGDDAESLEAEPEVAQADEAAVPDEVFEDDAEALEAQAAPQVVAEEADEPEAPEQAGPDEEEDDFSVFDRPLFPARPRAEEPAAPTPDEDIFVGHAPGANPLDEAEEDAFADSGRETPFRLDADEEEISSGADEGSKTDDDEPVPIPPLSGGRVREFGLKADDHSRLSPHGDMDANVLAGSSLAKSGLGKLWLFLAVFILLAGGSAAVYFGRDMISDFTLFDSTENPRETAENMAAGRDTESGEALKDKVVTSTSIRVSEMQRPDASLPDGDGAQPPAADAPADGIADVLNREADERLTPSDDPAASDAAPQSVAEAERAEQVAREEAAATQNLAEQQAEQAEQTQIVDQTRPVGENEGPAARGAALYEESPDDANKELAWSGTVTWELGAEVLADGQTVPTIIGEIAVPGRGMTARMIVRRNFDDSFDASHTIDLEFENAAGENLPMVQDVGAVLLKQEEPVRGEPLVAGKAKVTDGYFLFALSDKAEAREKNTALMKEREWFDVPILFNDNRKAIVVFTKGVEGQSVFANAFATWKNIEKPAAPAEGQAGGQSQSN